MTPEEQGPSWPRETSCDVSDELVMPPMRPLTRRELDNSVQALVGVALDTSGFAPELRNPLGINKDGSNFEFSRRDAEDMLFAVSGAVDRAISAGSAPLLDCEGDSACFEREMGLFLEMAWRRPLDPEALSAAIALVDNGSDYREGVALALKFALLSPEFRFVVHEAPSVEGRMLDDFELAERLSLMFWNRIPDRELIEKARRGELSSVEGLRGEIGRLLDDRDGVRAFIKDFGDQWLDLDLLSGFVKDRANYEELVPQMELEFSLLFESFLRDGRTVTELMTTQETIASEGLADLYGADWSGRLGDNLAPDNMTPMYRLPLPRDERYGLLTLSGALNASSTKESEPNPTLRGYWATKSVLCRRPPPPPPGAAETMPMEDLGPNPTVREELALHLSAATDCFGCHRTMDPVGLGLHNYDSVGVFREVDGRGHDVDPTGELYAKPFGNHEEMIDLIVESGDHEVCLVSHLASWSRGEEVDGRNSCLAQELRSAALENGGSLRSFLEALVLSPLFRFHGSQS